MVVCAKSGGRLLPSEIDYSSVSNLRVDQRLLQKSEFSKSLALPEELRTCAVSDRKGVLADGVMCAQTGQWIAKEYARICSVTKRFVRADFCVESQISKRWMYQSHAIQSFRSGEWLHPDEAAYCYWNEGYLRKTLTAVCERTKLSFASELIDRTGQFHLLTPFMLERVPSEDAAARISTFKDKEPVALKRLQKLFVVQRSPNSTILFFRGHGESKWRLAFYHGLIVAYVKDSKIEIMSPLTRQMSDGTWKVFP